MAFFFIIAIAVVLAILFFGHLAVYWFLISVFPVNGGLLFAVQIIIGILWLSFIAASVISQKFNNATTRTLYKISAAWLGFFAYLLIGACVYAIAVALFPASSPQIMSLIGETLILVAIIVGIYGIINANRIQITSIKVSIPNLPKRWKSRKAVFVSDLHLGQVRGAPFAERIVSKIQELNPEIVFIGGDLYDGIAVDVHRVIEPFSRLKVPLGIYFIMGNHEEFSDNSKYLSAIRGIGIKTLMDEKVMIDDVQLIGVDYKHASKKEVFDGILQSLHIDRKTPSILLKHVPSDLDVALKNGVTLQLSGHTHRAQIFPFTFLAHWIFKGFDYGLHPLGSMQVYTSSGVGTWGPPLRVGTKSEIVEILFQ
jgi:predicted MPP superfamily phosphohydrolase